MRILSPLILLAIVLGIAGLIGFYMILASPWIVFAGAFLSAFLVMWGVRSIQRGNREGDGGMGDALFGLLMILFAVGGWIGYIIGSLQ